MRFTVLLQYFYTVNKTEYMTEKWLPIKGYEGLYQVSDLGRVKSMRKNSVMSLSDTTGYYHVNLSIDGKRKTYLVHRLVSMAFIQNPKNKPCVDHINGDRRNNKVSNLRWCTMMENQNFPLAIKNKIGINSKESNYRYKIERKDNPFCKEVAQLDLDLNIIRFYNSISEASEILNISQSCISMVCSGVREKTKGFVFKFKKDYDGTKNNRRRP